MYAFQTVLQVTSTNKAFAKCVCHNALLAQAQNQIASSVLPDLI
jgi:hypothetical protein